jgi:hypothetical protein
MTDKNPAQTLKGRDFHLDTCQLAGWFICEDLSAFP